MRFAAKLPRHISGLVVKSPSGCWEYTGTLDHGYGTAPFRGKHTRVHRIAYEAYIGPIPPGLVIDHLCRNKACCNPKHLEAVTNQENIRRGDSYLAISAQDHGDLVTVTQAAKLLGVKRHNVQARIVAGLLAPVATAGSMARPVRLLRRSDLGLAALPAGDQA